MCALCARQVEEGMGEIYSNETLRKRTTTLTKEGVGDEGKSHRPRAQTRDVVDGGGVIDTGVSLKEKGLLSSSPFYQ